MAQLAVEEMDFDEIANEDGVKNIMARLREFFLPHLEVSLPRALETAVYGRPRQSTEGFPEFIARMEKAFSRLTKEGVELPDGATGYILYRQASLSEPQEQRLLMWCDGKYDKMSIVKALRKLDKVVKEKSNSKGTYLMDIDDAVENDTYLQAEDEDGDGEEFIYVAEGDLDGAYTEEEMMEALASYREIRDALKNQRNGRGFYNRENFKGKGFGQSKGKGKGKHRVHIEQLKLRTRCWSCGALGHLSRECTSKGSEKGKHQSNGAPAGSSAASTKTGFFIVQDEGDLAHSSECFPGDSAGSAKETFWLRQFVEERKQALRLTESSPARSAYKAASSDSQFCGITTNSEVGVVDTAAEGGLVGINALQRLEHRLHDHGLAIKWVPKKSLAKGIGGQAQVVGVAMIPLGIGGICGLLEVTVVEGEVPLLLPVKLLKHMKVILDFIKYKFILPDEGLELNMSETPSGHVTIDILHFPPDGFAVPASAPFCREDFCFSEKHSSHAGSIRSTQISRCPDLRETRHHLRPSWPT